jgi:hypothetical protein
MVSLTERFLFQSSVLYSSYIKHICFVASDFIIVVIIIIISFMQGIRACIRETNHVPTEYSVAAIL